VCWAKFAGLFVLHLHVASAFVVHLPAFVVFSAVHLLVIAVQASAVCRTHVRTHVVPEIKEAWLNLGQALKEEGRVKDAERALTKVAVFSGVCVPQKLRVFALHLPVLIVWLNLG
jgi:hypothetical protein